MKVSVAVITYNHEPFIAEALESILMQQADFSWEIVIGEDGSTDRTREICEQYANAHPSRIRLLPLQSNMGMIRNFRRVFEACSGEFLAFTEGDDFWTDPGKLVKQVNHLDAHPEQSLCFHAVHQWFVWNGENASRKLPDNLNGNTFTTEDLLKGWFIPSASVMLRKYKNFALPDWFMHCKSGDIPMLLLLSLRGEIGFIDEIMAVYRIHDNGISITHRGYQKIIAMIYILEQFNIHTGFRFRKSVEASMIREIDLHYPSPAVSNSTPTSQPGEKPDRRKSLDFLRQLIRR
jgi:glycosyltransferase involved in cell wall biosynthesis